MILPSIRICFFYLWGNSNLILNHWLKIEEFIDQNAMDYETEMQSCKQSAYDLKMPRGTEVVCQHKSSAVQSGFGLCGGLDGSQPPAFQRTEVEKSSKESMTKLTESTSQETVHSENVWSTISQCYGYNLQVLRGFSFDPFTYSSYVSSLMGGVK